MSFLKTLMDAQGLPLLKSLATGGALFNIKDPLVEKAAYGIMSRFYSAPWFPFFGSELCLAYCVSSRPILHFYFRVREGENDGLELRFGVFSYEQEVRHHNFHLVRGKDDAQGRLEQYLGGRFEYDCSSVLGEKGE